MYHIEWTDANNTRKFLKVHTITTCKEVLRTLDLSHGNRNISFVYRAPRRVREIVITVEP